MKKIISTIIILAMLIQYAVFAEDTISLVYRQDFDTVAVGSVPNGVSVLARGHNIAVKESGKNRYMNLEVNMSASQGSPYYQIGLSSPKSEKYVVEMSIMWDKIDGLCESFVAIRNTAGDVAKIVNSKGKAVYVGNNSVKIADVTEGKFYNIAAVVNLNKNTYDVYLDGSLKAKGINLGTYSAADINDIRVMTMSLQAGCESSFNLDNLVMYTGDELIDASEFSGSAEVLDPRDIVNIRNMVKEAIVLYPGTEKTFIKGKTKSMAQETFKDQSGVYIPLRAIMELLGNKVTYNGASNSVDVKVDTTIHSIDLDAVGEVVQVKSDTTYIKAEKLADMLGKMAQVDKTGIVFISDKEEYFDWNTDMDILLRSISHLIYDRPSADTIYEDIKENGLSYPRTFATKDDFKRIKAALDSGDEKIVSWYNRIKAKTDEQLNEEPLPFKLSDSFRTGNTGEIELRIINRAFLWHMTGEKKYAEAAKRELLGFCSDELWPDWNPYFLLGMGTVTELVGLGYDMLHDYLTEEERTYIRETTAKKAYVHYKNDMNKLTKGNGGKARPEPFTDDLMRSTAYWTMQPKINWTFVICGGMITSALAFMGEGDDSAAREILELAMEDLEEAFDQFAPDGGYSEGAGYWNYLMTYYAVMIRGMENACGTDYGLLKAPAFDMSLDYILNIQGSGGIFNFSDSSETTVADPYMYTLSRIFNKPEAAAAINNLINSKASFSPDLKSVIYYLDYSHTNEETDFDKDVYWRGIETAMLRSDWNYSTMNLIGMHGGRNDANHAHHDTGTIILEAMGKRFINDLGNDDYNVYNAGGTKIYRKNVQGHNCMVFNPKDGTYGQVTAAGSEILEFKNNKADSFAVTDLTEVYSPYVSSYKRAIRLGNNRNVMILQDEYELLPSVEEMYWGIHTKAEVTLSDDARRAYMKINNVILEARILGCEGETFYTSEAKPIEGTESSVWDKENHNAEFTKLGIKFSKIKSGKLAVVFVPYFEDDDKAEFDDMFPTEITPIDRWELMDDSNYTDYAPELTTLKINGNVVDGFDPGVTEYNYYQEFENDELPQISAEGNGNIKITQIQKFGQVATANIEANGRRTKYRINMFRLPGTKIENVNELEISQTTVSAEPQPQNNKDNMMDGSFDTRWSAMAPCNAIFDLGEKKTVDYIGMATYLGAERILSFKIRISDDGVNWKDASSYVSGGTTNEYEYYALDGVDTRYIQVVGYGTSAGTWVSITEFCALQKKR